MKRSIIFINVLFILSTISVFAQLEPPQRTDELEKLNVFVGTWTSEGKIYPDEETPAIETKGESTFEWVMDRTWLLFKSGGGRLQGHGYITWDKELGKYAFFWFDNLITKPTSYHGNWLDSQTFALNGKLEFRGKIIYTKIDWQFLNENEIRVVRKVSTDGRKFRISAELSYIRVH